MTATWRRLLGVLVLLAGLLTQGAPAIAAGAPSRAGDGARVVGEEWLSDRMVDLTIDSPALDAESKVRLLVPPGWSATSHKRWPVLYLLHGCCGDYTSWTALTDVEELTARTGVLVVMPEAGNTGWYSNWWNGGRFGPPAWETFHLTEVRQLLERGYGAGGRRAIAGLSMGGFGTLSYAARHPGMFRSAASFSGVVDTRQGADLVQGILAAYGFDPLALWGDPAAQERIWAAHNPTDLARRLRGIPVYVSCGDGRPGPFDDPARPVDTLEQALLAENEAFVASARAARVRLTVNLYGPGTHSWPYWQRELHASFPMLMRSVGARER
jgi:diacylglycerol O-acyltransferase/trehalose O-mycolyltransferase